MIGGGLYDLRNVMLNGKTTRILSFVNLCFQHFSEEMFYFS